MIVVLTQPGDRLKEYAADRRHGRFILKNLLPYLEKKIPSAAIAIPAGAHGCQLRRGSKSLLCLA